MSEPEAMPRRIQLPAVKSYLRVQVKSDILHIRRSNRTKMATSRRHLVTKHETGRTHVRAQKGWRRNQESCARLSLIHSDPFYLENSSRKGRSISRKARERGLSPCRTFRKIFRPDRES